MPEPVGDEHPREDLGGSAGHARLPEALRLEDVDRAIDAADATIGRVIAGRRAAVESDSSDRRDDVRRHAVQREGRVVGVRGDRCFEMAHADIGGRNDGSQPGEHRREVHPHRAGVVPREVVFGLAPQRAVPEGIAGEGHRQAAVTARGRSRCRRRRRHRSRGRRRRARGRPVGSAMVVEACVGSGTSGDVVGGRRRDGLRRG